MEKPSVATNRRSPRNPVLLSASVEVHGVPVAVKLRNLSEEGALIEGPLLPPVGSPTCFERQRLRVAGTIVWVDGRFAGLAFARSLRREEVLRHIPQPQARVQPDFRRPGFSSRQLSAAERKLLESWGTAATVVRSGD